MTTLTIKHVAHFDKTGRVTFRPNTRKNDTVEVVAFYPVDSRVRTKSGDVYAAKLLPNGHFETVGRI
jgi:hypothetical protein